MLRRVISGRLFRAFVAATLLASVASAAAAHARSHGSVDSNNDGDTRICAFCYHSIAEGPSPGLGLVVPRACAHVLPPTAPEPDLESLVAATWARGPPPRLAS